jgi:hypothetical protein
MDDLHDTKMELQLLQSTIRLHAERVDDRESDAVDHELYRRT